MTFDKIYFNGKEVLKRENISGDRVFYCDSPLQLILALSEVIKEMNHNKFAKLETYNNGTVYILVSNICSIEEYGKINDKYTSITMNSGDRHTVKLPVEAISAILEE